MILRPEQIVTHSLRRLALGESICKIIASAINNSDARTAIKRHVRRDSDYLNIDDITLQLNYYRRVFVIGAGKACFPMAIAISEILPDRISSGLLITKTGYRGADHTPISNKIKIIEASHPIPDFRNIEAADKLISLTKGLTANDLVICLFSGGGSSLMIKPTSGISLQAIQRITALLLSCGASINEINTIRKHLDDFKGGRLLKLLFPSTIISLILSDVVGDSLDMVASGPTVADPSTFIEAWRIINKYQIADQAPPQLISLIAAGMEGKIPETVKPGDPNLANITNILVGNNAEAVDGVIENAKTLGFSSSILRTSLKGEASQAGLAILKEAKENLERAPQMVRPACLISGGETTVTIKGTGKGGRNQELALSAINCVSGTEPMVLATLATDGEDGPTDAAGAVVTNETYSRGVSMGLDPGDFLARNDSYHYFEALGDLIKTGPTLTNVNDLIFVFAL